MQHERYGDVGHEHECADSDAHVGFRKSNGTSEKPFAASVAADLLPLSP